MATAHRHTGGGLNSSSGGELKLYLKGKRNTLIKVRCKKGEQLVLPMSTYIYAVETLFQDYEQWHRVRHKESLWNQSLFHELSRLKEDLLELRIH